MEKGPMNECVLAGCGALFLVVVILAWLLLHRRKKPQFRRSLIIAECLQPQLQCKPVPCQHPYYRVISEFSEKPVQVHVFKDNFDNMHKPEIQKKRNSFSSQKGRNSRASSLTDSEKGVVQT